MILAFETGRQLGTRAIFAEEVKGDGAPRREFRRGFRIEPGERVLLVDDILTTGGLAPGDDPGRRGGGRRDRRVRGDGRSIRRAAVPGFAHDRAPVRPQRAVGPRPADLRGRARRRVRSAPRGPRSTHPGAPARALPDVPRLGRWLLIGVASSLGSACLPTWARRAPAPARSPQPPLPPSPVDGVVVAVDSAGLGQVKGFTLRLRDGSSVTLHSAHLENATEFSPSHLSRAPGVERAGPRLLSARRRRARRLPPRGRPAVTPPTGCGAPEMRRCRCAGAPTFRPPPP